MKLLVIITCFFFSFSLESNAQDEAMSAKDMVKAINSLTIRVNNLSKHRPVTESRERGRSQRIIINATDENEGYVCFTYLPKLNTLKLKPGSVMSASADGSTYKMTDEANDKKVVGVLVEEPVGRTARKNYFIAVNGKVRVRVACRNDEGKIAVGDLLVSSDAPGIAMKAKSTDVPANTIIGKALEPLKNCYGEDSIMVLLSHE